MRGGDGIKPSSEGKRVVFDGEGRTVIDGPFPAVNELVAGFWLWEVKDMDEAVEWLKRCPNPMPGPSAVEIRPRGTHAGGAGGAVTGSSLYRQSWPPKKLMLRDHCLRPDGCRGYSRTLYRRHPLEDSGRGRP